VRCDIERDDGSKERKGVSPYFRWPPRKHLVVSGLKRSWIADDTSTSLGHFVKQSMVERGKVVMRYQQQRPLIEAPLHGVVELLSKYTSPVKRVRAAMWSIWRADVDVGRIVSDGEVESEIFSSFGRLLLGKAVEADGTQVCGGEGDVWWVEYFDLHEVSVYLTCSVYIQHLPQDQRPR
jgi:hypothetical protein